MTAPFFSLKRKRSSDAVSDAGTCHTEQTDGSNVEVDEKSQLLRQKREQHVAARLELEKQIQQAAEQKQHAAMQLEQLEGVECSRDPLGVSDLRQQLQTYQLQGQQACAQLAALDKSFKAAVADILGIAAEQEPKELAAAFQEQQHLQAVQAQQLAVVQQLADSEFAVTSSSKQQSKRAKVERMSQVWDWLHGSNASAATNSAEANTAAEAQQGAHNTEQQKQPPKSMQAIQVAGD